MTLSRCWWRRAPRPICDDRPCGHARRCASRARNLRDAVDATHGFLAPEHRVEIDRLVADEFLPNAEMWLVDGPDGRAAGFLVMDGAMIDALFVDPALHGRGYGTALLDHALTLSPQATVEASEQADNALSFYEARGFVRIGRSETDPQGRPYPLVLLEFVGKR